jgi:hypothetical protein
MSEQTLQLTKHIANLMKQISEAASAHDLAAIQRLSRKAAELHELKEQVASIQRRITSLTVDEVISDPVAARQQSNGRNRELAIEVTGGDLRQNLLKLTPYIKRGKIKVGEEMMVEALPSGERFQTVVSEKGNKLRARGEIARFYRDAEVKAGDYVLLTEVALGRWSLKKAPLGEYRVREYV